jgi:hypothetical protein
MNDPTRWRRAVIPGALMAVALCGSVQAQPLTVTTNVTFPVPAGTTVTWTASNSSPQQTYRFWVDDGAGWIVARDWAASNSFDWIPPAEGTYSIQVWMRAVNSTANFDDYVFAGPVRITPPLPLTVSSFSPDVSTTASVPGGTPITWTATATGGVGPYSYRFWADQGSGWVLLRDWNTLNSFVWIARPGTYTFLVTVRSASSSADFEAYRYYGPVAVGTQPPLTVTSFDIAPSAPHVEGTALTLSATASGGIPPYSYQFWFDKWGDTEGWVLLRDWSVANSVVWTPPPGIYYVLVWVRDATSTSGMQHRSSSIQIVPTFPIRATSLTANVTFPVVENTLVTWTLTASGGAPPYQYRFDVFDTSTMPPVQTVVRDWSPDNTLVWPAGHHSIIGFVRGSEGGPFDTISAGVTLKPGPPPLSISAFTATGPSAAVTLSATASGGIGPYTFRFWADNGSGWVLIRDWDASGTAIWTPAPGTYTLLVMGRNAGSATAYDALRYYSNYVPGSPPPPLSVTSLQPAPPPAGVQFPTEGVPTTFTATAFGGTAPYSFQFWIDTHFDAEGWQLVRDWDPANSFTWIPDDNIYHILVWAKSTNATAGEAYRIFPFYFVHAAPALLIDSLTPNVPLPVTEGTPVTWTATATGGIAPLSYRFWADADDGRGWILLRDWSPSNSFVWVPTPGTYTLQVTARNAYSTAAFNAYRFSGPVTVHAAQPLNASLTFNGSFPRVAGDPVTWTANATGGVAPLSYQFWVDRWDDGATGWLLQRDWSTSNTFTYNPGPGNYDALVWVRSANSTTGGAYAVVTGAVITP